MSKVLCEARTMTDRTTVTMNWRTGGAPSGRRRLRNCGLCHLECGCGGGASTDAVAAVVDFGRRPGTNVKIGRLKFVVKSLPRLLFANGWWWC
jgi:hypothetical protein